MGGGYCRPAARAAAALPRTTSCIWCALPQPPAVCEANLEVALALLRPSVFPELLQGRAQNHQPPWQRQGLHDPGVAAVQAGQPQLLGWLVRHCPGLLDPDLVLGAAAKHCTLAGLKAAWATLNATRPAEQQAAGGGRELDQAVMDAAAASATPDATAKMQWLLSNRLCECSESTTVAAARAGDLQRLKWMRRHRHMMYSDTLVERTPHDADLTVVEWLVDDARCGFLPPVGSGSACFYSLLLAAVQSASGVCASCAGCGRVGCWAWVPATWCGTCRWWRPRRGRWRWCGACCRRMTV